MEPQGLVYDRTATDYERGRTNWPDEICAGVEASRALDLGAGTGKLTRLLVRHYPHVVAVEPLPRMRGLGADLVPGAEWLAGTAERIPLADASVDAAFVADAFHWFDPVAGGAELARVLRPGGTAVVTFSDWNGPFQPALPRAAIDLMHAVSARTGSTGLGKWQSGAWQIGFADDRFTPLVHRSIPFGHETDRAGVIAYYLSMSTIAARPEHERADFEAQMRNLVTEGTYRVTLRAETYSAQRR